MTKMYINRTVVEQALEALESGLLIPHSAEVFTALRAALAEPQDEPIKTPLYTAPPQRLPLTEEEIGLLTTDDGWSHLETPALALFARAVEQAHGIKE